MTEILAFALPFQFKYELSVIEGRELNNRFNMENQQVINQKKNSQLSLVLILTNVILALLLSTTGEQYSDPLTQGFIYFILAATILLGGFVFTYHGKVYLWAKIVFAISFVICLVLFGLLWYATALGHAFQN